MANDTVLLPGGGGDTIRTEEIGLVKYPVSKIALGAAGVDDGDVSAANPMPVTGTLTVNVGLTDSQLRATPVPVSGTLTVNVGLTDAQLRATAVPVSGPLTDAQLRATPIAVTGTVTSTGGLTDAELRATPVPVSGPLTDAQLRATPVPVSGTVTTTISGVATEAKQDMQITSLQLLDDVIYTALGGEIGTGLVGRYYGSGIVPTGGGSDVWMALRSDSSGQLLIATGTAIQVTGSVAVTNSGAFAVQATQNGAWTVTGAGGTFPVTGTFFQATQPVSGPLTDAELRATPVPISGTVTATTGGLTDAQLRASAVPVSLSTVAVTNTGTFLVQAAQSGTWTVQIGNTPNSTPILTSERPATFGGLSVSSFLSTAAVQSTSIKGSAGQVYALEFFNIGATPMYVRLYNMNTAPGSGDNANIIWRGVIPGNTAGAGVVKSWNGGLEFTTGIGMRCTGLIGDTDNTALAANTVIGNVDYK